MGFNARDALSEFWASRVSKLGIFFMLTLFAISLYVLVSYPSNFGTTQWNRPQHWADYPKGVPPTWTQMFTSIKKVEHQTISTDIEIADVLFIDRTNDIEENLILSENIKILHKFIGQLSFIDRTLIYLYLDHLNY